MADAKTMLDDGRGGWTPGVERGLSHLARELIERVVGPGHAACHAASILLRVAARAVFGKRGAPTPRDRAHEAIRRDAARAARVLSAWVNERREVSR